MTPKIISRLVNSKRGKIALFVLVALLVASASATVYVFFYANTTATVQAPDIKLYAGSDSIASSCTVYPCAHVGISSTSDVATISMSMFPADTAATPVPASYYTNITAVKNTGTTAHSIKSVQITNVAGASNLGQITVYYCTAQTEFNASGNLITPGNCVGSFAITSATGGSVSGTFPVSIAGGAVQYIEIVAYANSGVTSGSVTFNIAIQWA